MIDHFETVLGGENGEGFHKSSVRLRAPAGSRDFYCGFPKPKRVSVELARLNSIPGPPYLAVEGAWVTGALACVRTKLTVMAVEAELAVPDEVLPAETGVSVIVPVQSGLTVYVPLNCRKPSGGVVVPGGATMFPPPSKSASATKKNGAGIEIEEELEPDAGVDPVPTPFSA